MNREGVSVFAGGQPAGRLFRSDTELETFLFAYDPGCPDERAISLTMPVVADQYDSMGFLHPVFEMNLPEGVLRQTLERMFAKAIKDFDALTLLEIVGKSQIGRLRYTTAGEALAELPTESIDKILTFHGGRDYFDSLMEKFAAHSGISGMQPKILVRDEKTVFDKVADKGATHIVKSFNPAEYPELALNEFFSLRAALHAGLPVATAHLSENRAVLVIERFDRRADGSYLGFEDFCVLSGLRSHGRYNSSYEALAQKVAIYVSPPHHQAAMRQLFGTVALSCVIRNGDAHLKNFGVLYDEPGVNVRLAPVYDLLSTVPYLPKDILALELNDSKSYPSSSRLLHFARQSCGLTQRVAESILLNVARGVEQAIEEMGAYANQHPDCQEPIAYFTKIFRDGLLSIDHRASGSSQQ
mgnify:CR=1 FL=1